MRYVFSTVAALTVFASLVHAQNPLERFAEVRREIVARNSARALALLDSLAVIVPDHPNLTYLRAHAYGVAGRMRCDGSDSDTLAVGRAVRPTRPAGFLRRRAPGTFPPYGFSRDAGDATIRDRHRVGHDC